MPAFVLEQFLCRQSAMPHQFTVLFVVASAPATFSASVGWSVAPQSLCVRIKNFAGREQCSSSLGDAFDVAVSEAAKSDCVLPHVLEV